MSAVSNNYSQRDFLNDFNSSSIKVDDGLLSQVADNMTKAGCSTGDVSQIKSELESVAGKDSIIQGDEFNTLFTKLDSHDKNGSSNSFALTNANGDKTLCGAVVDVLKDNRATAKTYTLSDFNKEFSAGEVVINTAFLSKLSKTLGQSPYSLSVTERNTICNNLKEIAGSDGKIDGNELQKLFKEIDSHDSNGSNSSFTVSTTVGDDVTVTTSGAILGAAQNQYVENYSLQKSDILAALKNASISLPDISVLDQLSLTAIGVSLAELKACCDDQTNFVINSDAGKASLFDYLDKLDGNVDKAATTEQRYIGKESKTTKAGEVWAILQKYAVTGKTIIETNGGDTSAVNSNPGVKTAGSGEHLTADNAKSVSTWVDTGLTASDKSNIKSNRKLIEHRVDLQATKYNSPSGATIYGNIYGGNAKNDPTPTALQGAASQQARWIYAELAGEGGASSVNTYDGQLFTFGRGFAGKSGSLTTMLTKWLANEDVAAEFAKYGVAIKETVNSKTKKSTYELAVVDSNGVVKTGKEAYQVIYNSDDLQHLFINMAEDARFSQSCVDAQYETAMGAAGNVPDYAKNWNEEMSRLGAHMAHWLPVLGWRSNDYSACKSAVGLAVQSFTVMGKKVAAGTASWTKSYKSVAATTKTFVIGRATGRAQLQAIDDGKVWEELKAVCGSSKSISQADINAGKYNGYVLFADPNASGKYYVISQSYKG